MTTDILQSIRHLINSRYVPGVKAYISELTGFTTIIGPDEISTMEVNPLRLNIRCDERGFISSFRIG
ncbi:I78 family peptidase inhibitor [Pseudomonas silesiensis]|uniref:I78 family peptidase inhibitor n=1 Tax=Pseudomonas silesiensis TaxID=1853130 RepID=UPI000F97F5D1